MIYLKGKNLYIREINNSDLKILHVWRNSDDFINFCSKRKFKISFLDFGYEINKDLKNDRLFQVVAISNSDVFLGTLFAYGYNKNDSSIYVTTFFSSGSRNFGYGVEALLLFGKYLFCNFGVSKLYVEVYSYNKKVLKMLKKVGFREENRFIKNCEQTNEEYNLHVLFLPKKELENLAIEKLFKRLT